MKKQFDIHHYREIGDDYNKKLIYINGCLFEARKCSIRNAINELKYISLQVKEYCVITEIRLPDNIPSGRKMLRQCDAAIIDYVNERIEYFSGLDELSIIENKKPNKDLPSLPECFIDSTLLNELLNDYHFDELCTRLPDGSYKWNGSKIELAGFAHRLMNRGKLIGNIKNGQHLARVFCPFFKEPFNTRDDRDFHADRSSSSVEKFDWIK